MSVNVNKSLSNDNAGIVHPPQKISDKLGAHEILKTQNQELINGQVTISLKKSINSEVHEKGIGILSQ